MIIKDFCETCDGKDCDDRYYVEGKFYVRGCTIDGRKIYLKHGRGDTL